MTIATTARLTVCFVVLGTALGCSSQFTAPSSLSAVPTAGRADDTSAVSPSQSAAASPSRFGGRTPGVVYVTSQGLYYDTFVVKDPLPMEGQFQLLVNGTTEFGPGQAGYLGGRWWVDENGNGAQDSEDQSFVDASGTSCPDELAKLVRSGWSLLTVVKLRVRTARPEDGRMFQSFTKHSRVADSARIHRLNLRS